MTRSGDLSAVAPYHSCIVCFRGDTTTGLALIGSLEFHAAALVAVGVPMEQATATVSLPETDPDLAARIAAEGVYPVRVCSDCASRGHMTVGEVPNLPVYREDDLAS